VLSQPEELNVEINKIWLDGQRRETGIRLCRIKNDVNRRQGTNVNFQIWNQNLGDGIGKQKHENVVQL
jgi:hypothetical protein